MESKEILLERIRKNRKEIIEFYPYPTGGYGTENEILKINYDYESGDLIDMRNFIEAVIQIGALVSKRRNDNKIAVGIMVDDILEPIYFYKYDGSYHITTQVIQRDNVEPTKISYRF